MPELPEVETVRLGLEASILQKTISSIKILPGTLYTDQKICIDALSKILAVQRYGKYLLIKLANNKTIVSHLRMTGQYIFIPKNKLAEKITSHTRTIFNFKDGSALLFQDQRKFGTIELFDNKDLKNYFQKRKLGKDALDEDFSKDPLSFISKFKNKSTPIKTALLDQTIVAGLGNIYAMELCYLSKILPQTPANKVKKSKLKHLHSQIYPLLKSAIKHNGTTFDGKYVTSNGSAGEFSKFLNVYGKKFCNACNSTITKIKLNGRGTYFCPTCQK